MSGEAGGGGEGRLLDRRRAGGGDGRAAARAMAGAGPAGRIKAAGMTGMPLTDAWLLAAKSGIADRPVPGAPARGTA